MTQEEIELEAEAKKYASDFIKDKDLIELQVAAYIECATNSKYVEKQKLEFAIEHLKSISLGLMDANTVTVSNLLQKINELEQKLK